MTNYFRGPRPNRRNVTIDQELWDELGKLAAEERNNVSEQIRICIEERLTRLGRFPGRKVNRRFQRPPVA